MKLYSFRYLGPQALKSMKANGWMTFAAIMTITISLFLCAFFWLILTNMDANATEIEEDVRVMAYIDSSVRQSDYEEIEQQISWIDGVQKVTFISKEEGLESMSDRFGGIDLDATLGGANPLPDMYSVEAVSTAYVKNIAEQAAEIEGVSSVRYGEGTVERLFTLTNTLRQGGIIVMSLLGIAAVFLIAMSIRLTILNRRKEIMVMKWCGATDAFIRWPFFLEGLLLGIIGAVLALAFALLLYGQATDYLSSTISFITIMPLKYIWQNVTLFVLGCGVVLGAIGSIIPLTRFLRV